MSKNLTQSTTIPPDVDRFLVDLRGQEVAPKTVTNYASDLSLFATWFQGSTGDAFTAAAVTPTDVRDYRGYLQTVAGAKPATVNRRFAALRRFFLWAKALKLVSELPTEGVKGVRSTPTAPKALDRRDADRLIRQAERDGSKRNLAILQLLRHTGIRVGELCQLRLSDITISERKGSLTVRSGKGSKHRVVPLNLDARKAISDYLTVRPTVPDDLLFISQRGEGLKVRAVEDVVKKYARLAGLELSPHTLRHTFARSALDSGTDLVAVATLLGHQRLETTAIYTKPSARDLEKAVERLETR
jgi:site-specific recombinase XerD